VVINLHFKIFTESYKISPRKFASVLLLTSGTLGWFFLLNSSAIEIFSGLVPSNSSWLVIGQILFYGFAILWALVGSLIAGKIDRRKLLLVWIALGFLTTISMAFIEGPIFSIILCSLLGLSLGLGLPSSMAYIADCTVAEERARVSGIILFLAFLMAAFGSIIADIIGFGTMGLLIIAALLRSTSFLAFVFPKCERQKEEKGIRHTFTTYKEFTFYLFPWVLINIASALAVSLIPNNPDYSWALDIGQRLRLLLIAVSALAAGAVADRFGRKNPLLIGVITMGISFVLIGFAMSPISAFIFLLISGFSWGSFFTIFLSIPGDLAIPSSRERFYFLSTVLPIVILFITSPFLGPGSLLGFPATFSQILSLIIFLSIIPLWLAKESLPESKMHARRMKEYLNKVGKLVEETKKE
jgi:MFS family permease